MGGFLKRRAKLQLLHDVVVESRLDASQLLRTVLQDLAQTLECDYIVLARNNGDRVHLDAVYAADREGRFELLEIPEEFPPLPLAGVPSATIDVFEDPALAGNDLVRRLRIRSFIALPIAALDKTWHCLFAFKNARTAEQAADAIKLLEACASLISQLLELREEQHSQAQNISTDPLTGLMGRAPALKRFREEIASAERNRSRVALLFLDVDRFKWVNDTYGHAAGDVVLQEIAKRLKMSLRPYDVAGRIGGDEFAIAISDFSSDDELAEIATRLIASLSQPLLLENTEIMLSASIGVAIFPNDASTIEELIRRADSAMYTAKREHPGTFAFYSPTAEERAKSRRVISEGLRARRMDREFVLCLQPIVEARSAHASRAEVLTRWIHPELGLLPPSNYVEIARDSHLSSLLDGWVLRRSIETASELARRGMNVRLHVNVSEASDATLDAAVKSGLIAIELNEALIARAWKDCESFIKRARAMGFEVGIDGFGASGLSLARLSHLDVDFVKIDRQLTSQITMRRTAVPALDVAIAIAREFGWQIIAEGVQNDLQRKRLTDAGVDYLQGYLIAHPMTAVDFQNWLTVPT